MAHLDTETAHQLLGGRLDSAASAAAEDHLKACSSCRDLVLRERTLLNMLKLDDRPDADVTALNRLLERIEVAEPGGARRLRRRRRLTAAAGVVVALTLTYGVYLFWPQPGPNHETARALGISRRQQTSIVARLDALSALQRDRWLIANYEAVASLDGHIREERE